LALTAGTSLGPYEIVVAIGAGGMGEVYRARDTKLNRDVALKILPSAFTNDVERLARFNREAQVLASLNHPNIAAIYGFEDSGATHALVMELVEGEDLSAHIARNALPLAEALPIAKQIAEALEAAHEQGIVHRDLKPANIKVRADGTVKVLDFGLAKAIDPASSSNGEVMNSPTMTARATQLGMIIGTAAYMSPEQAKGKPVDKRADIWAFGVVLFEMLSGRRLFVGEDVSDVLAAVLRQDIEWAALPTNTPARLRRVLERCLDRDVKTRLRDIGEARVELTGIASRAPDDAAASGGTPRSGRPSMIALTAGGLAILATGALADRYFLRNPTPPPSTEVRLALVPPVGLTFEAGRLDTVIVSPNGRQLAFSARSADGKRQLYVRALDGVDAKLLPGTQEPIKPFWSADSKSIAFGAQGKLKRVDISGGQPAIIADAPRLNGGAWNRVGAIIFSPDYNAGILQVSDRGGATKVVTMPDASRQEVALADPAFLPDDVHFLFSGGAPGKQEVRVGSLSSSQTTVVVEGGRAQFVSPNRIVFERAGRLMTGTFDPQRLLLGDDLAAAMTDDDGSTNRGDTTFSVSDTGVLVRKNGFAPDYQLVWFDRQGRSLGTVGAPTQGGAGEALAPRISPDGARVAIQRRGASDDQHGLWVIDLLHGLPTRVSSALGQYPLWSPDGRQLVWLQNVNGAAGLYRVAANGLGSAELLLKIGSEAGGTTFPNDWSTDGRFILYHTRGVKTRIDLWALPLFGDRKPYPVLNTEFDEGPGVLSPDGRWLAYRSDVSGTYEIYVQSFTADGHAGSERVRISTNGGSQPRFRPDGRELFYLADDGRLMAVPITAQGATFEHGEPKALFKTRTFPPIVEVRYEYDVTRDGQRFLMGTILDGPRATPPAPTILINWLAGLQR
jgi:serine/threonine protein kinase/Tol biopolymer transport system component